MKFSRLLVYSILVAILAAIVTLITDILQIQGIIAVDGSLTFVTFIMWASYFVWGADPQSAVKAWVSYITGIICAVIIYVSAGYFASLGMDFAFVALPLGVFFGVVFMCLGEKLPIGNNVSAIFLGAGTFFGMMGTPSVGAKGYFIVGIGELLYAALGLCAGFLTIQISNFVKSYGTQKVDTKING